MHCSHDILHKILMERRNQGRKEVTTHKDNPTHKLVGKRLRLKKTGKEYNVNSSKKTWSWGWYITLLLIDDNDSSVNISWELADKHPSGDDMIISHCRENQADFELVI